MQEDELILAVKSGSERAYKQLYELWVSRGSSLTRRCKVAY